MVEGPSGTQGHFLKRFFLTGQVEGKRLNLRESGRTGRRPDEGPRDDFEVLQITESFREAIEIAKV